MIVNKNKAIMLTFVRFELKRGHSILDFSLKNFFNQLLLIIKCK